MDKVSITEEEKENRPSPADFVTFLPWAVSQLQVQVELVITRVIQSDYVSVVSDRKSKQKKGKHTQDVGSDEMRDDVTASNFGMMMQMENVVRILAFYDTLDNLVQIKFEKNRHIPRKLMKIIGLIIKFQTHLSTIVINKGMDMYTLHEICNFLPVSHITDINLDDCYLAQANYYTLLEETNQLRHLSLCRCRIDDHVIHSIATRLVYPLPASKTLSILNLSTNRITDLGAKYLGEALRSNRHLSYLNLADNMVTDKGAGIILDALKEFSLKSDELLAARARHMTYLKEKDALISRYIKELRMTEMDKRAKKKLVRPTTTGSGKKSKMPEKEPSLKSVPEGATRSILNMDGMFYEKAEAMAENLLGEYQDPFCITNTISKDNMVFSFGNNALSYINLAYNNISYFTVRKLLDVLAYQKLQNRRPRGLINVSVEGNYLPISCKELQIIDDILEIGLMVQGRRTSGVKKKTQSRTGRL